MTKMMNPISITEDPELRPLRELGIKAGITCGITDPALAKRLALHCAESIRRRKDERRRFREIRDKYFGDDMPQPGFRC